MKEKDYKKIILDDFSQAVELMRKTSNPEETLFYFSSTFGVLSRVFNLKYDPELVFMHQILASTHAAILARIQAIKSGDGAIIIDEQVFEKLTILVDQLTNAIASDQKVNEILQRITILAYSTTGNGYYLLKKGVIQI